MTDREDGLHVPLALDEALRQERKVGSAHFDQVSHCDDGEHERKLEALDDVAMARQRGSQRPCQRPWRSTGGANVRAGDLEQVLFLKLLEDSWRYEGPNQQCDTRAKSDQEGSLTSFDLCELI